MNTFAFNTERSYTEHGQRIIVRSHFFAVGEYAVEFLDVDRGVGGWFVYYGRPVVDGQAAVRKAVMQEYDSGTYRNDSYAQKFAHESLELLRPAQAEAYVVELLREPGDKRGNKFINELRDTITEKDAQIAALEEGIRDVMRYVSSAKFEGGPLSGYVNVKDIEARCRDALNAAREAEVA